MTIELPKPTPAGVEVMSQYAQHGMEYLEIEEAHLLQRLADVREARRRAEPRCSAHGNRVCTWCSMNPADCVSEYGHCSTFSSDGMHWDTCPNRLRGPDNARARGFWPDDAPFPALGESTQDGS